MAHTPVTVGSLRALPNWHPPREVMTSPYPRPLTNDNLHHFAITVPVSATAGQGFSTTIEAQDNNDARIGITSTLSLTTTNGGTLTPTQVQLVSGTWSGPASLTKAEVGRTIRAISGTITGQASITIYAAAASALDLAPLGPTVQAGVSQTFIATATDPYGNLATTAPEWYAQSGEILLGPSATSIYTAQTTPAPHNDIVTATQSGLTASTGVSIVAGPLAVLTMTPTSITVTVSCTKSLTATGTDQYGNSVTLAPDWSSDVGQIVSNTTGLVASATFTAQHTPAPDTGLVTATQGAVQELSVVRILAGPLTTITVAPGATYLQVGTTQQFTASGTDASGNPTATNPAWTASAGTIDQTGRFTAPTAPTTAYVYASEKEVTGTAVVTVQPGPVDHFYVQSISTQTAGQNFTLQLEARDPYDNVATGYNGTAALSDSTGTLSGGPATFSDGTWSGPVNVTLATSGVRINVTDGPTTGQSNAFTVVPAALDYFTTSGYPSNTTAGDTFDGVVVTAYDEYDNVKTNYTGQVYFTSDDPSATLPYYNNNHYTFSSGSGGDNGAHAFDGFVLRTTPVRHLTVTDGSVSATSADITVHPAALARFGLSGYPGAVTAGASWDTYGTSVMVTAYDTYDNVKTDYGGAVYFQSDDPLAVLPYTSGTRYTFVPGDAGTHSFAGSGFELRRTSIRHLTVTDGAFSTQSSDINVAPAALDAFTIQAVGNQVAGATFGLRITAWDPFDNVKTNYNGRPTLSDPTGTLLPALTDANCFLNDGVCEQDVSITRAREDIRITAADVGVSQQSNLFDVSPAALHHIRINAAANNGGQSYGYPVEVGVHDMDIYQTYTVWAAGYDLFDNYRQDLAVNWGLTGILDQGDIAPSSGISATFTPAPVLSGTGTILATRDPGGYTDSTGEFTIRAPWLIISKSDEPDPVPASSYLYYTLVYTNVGTAEAQDVRITETYDANVHYAGAGPPPINPPPGDANVWTRSRLAVGASYPIYVTTRVDNSLDPGTLLNNLVTIGGSRLGQHTASATTVVTSTPDLTLTLTAQPDPVDAGANLFYQIRYANNGSAPVYNTVITLTYDDNVSFLSSTPAPNPGTDNVWSIGTIEGNGDNGEINITVLVDGFLQDQDILESRATIKSDQTSKYLDIEYTVVDAPVLNLTQVATPSPVQANSLLTFSLTYTNEGHADAAAVFLTETLPAFTDFDACQPSCERIGNLVRWDLQTLTDGEHGTASLVVAVHNNLDDGIVITGTAGLRALYGYHAGVSTPVVVHSAPELTLQQHSNVDPVRVTDALIYTLDYANAGNGPAYGVILTDFIPQHVTYQSGCASAQNCERDGRLITWTLGTVAASTGGQFNLHLQVDAPLQDQTLLTNSAVISAAERTRATAQLYTTVAAPHLNLEVQDHPDPVQANALLTLTLAYTNDGHGYANATYLTASLPNETTWQRCSPTPCNLVEKNTVLWELGTVDGKSSAQAQLVVHVDNNLDNGTMLTTNAELVAPAEVVSDAITLTTQVASQPSLWLNVNNGRTDVRAGDRVTFTLSYTNDGNSNAYSSTLVASLPDLALVDYQDCQGASCIRQGDTVTYQLGTVPGGSGGAAHLIVKVKDPLPAGQHAVGVSAVISTTTPDDPLQDNTSQDVDAVATRPDLKVQVDYYAQTPFPGQTITYTISYNNAGRIATTGLIMTATISKHATFDPAASSACWSQQADESYSCALGALDYDKQGQRLFVTVLPTPTFTSTLDAPNFDATFEIQDDGGSGPDENPSDNVRLSPLGIPDIMVESVQVNWASLLSGQHGAHVTITIKNQGTTRACNPIGHEYPQCGGFYADLYINPNPIPPSFPTDNHYGIPVKEYLDILPGQKMVAHFEFETDIRPPLTLYVRLDNIDLHPYGVVAESNEFNNVTGPITMGYQNYLPLLLRHR